EESKRPCKSAALQDHLSLPGISILDKLIKTCPVWLQLGLSQERAKEILQKEPAGVFLVRRDALDKVMMLSVHIPDQKIPENIKSYRIKEENSLLYLEGSLLVFEDIFKLVAFYCVSRDVLPFPLSLPLAVVEATSYQELETISNLSIGFWESFLNQRKGSGNSQAGKCKSKRIIQTNSWTSSQRFSSDTKQCSCEIELSKGNDRLWFVNPIFIEECSNNLSPDGLKPRSQSVKLEDCTVRRYKRPPPVPPRQKTVEDSGEPSMTTREGQGSAQGIESKGCENMKLNSEDVKEEKGKDLGVIEAPVLEKKTYKAMRQPPVPPRHRSSERLPLNPNSSKNEEHKQMEEQKTERIVSSSEGNHLQSNETKIVGEIQNWAVTGSDTVNSKGLKVQCEAVGLESPCAEAEKPKGQVKPLGPGPKPIPPPRKKRLSKHPAKDSPEGSTPPILGAKELSNTESTTTPIKENSCSVMNSKTSATPGRPVPISVSQKRLSSPESKDSDISLYSPEGNAATPALEHDSYSTSSTDDDLECSSSPAPKYRPHSSIMLDRAKHRLSMVTLTNVFTVFISADRKVQLKITELSQDKNSYFGCLVQDYKAYTIEMMGKHTSSTEMLQEIRQMMTQLKSYLIQSAELNSIIDPSAYTEEKLEAVIEASLCKSVLKPLRDSINSCLKEIHIKDGSLQLLKENQEVVQNTTTTDLGVTTSVPEVPIMEKLQQKFTAMYKAYSPEKKITILLKSCKLIYESMSIGNPGKHHGADDFLPVLMYVLARSNLTFLLLDVEYMMELMDPALQLGEGSYYLTTTYGALEHIKNYDKITVTRQLSMEVQDSIHRWERRRTLNKARVSRSSVQDFLSVSFLESGSNTRTLATGPDMTAQELCKLCAAKFEVTDTENYGVFVLVDDKCLQLASDALPQSIKSALLKIEPRKDYSFIYKQLSGENAPEAPPIKELTFI
uniref:Ras and Rab interactor 3 n=1 Tax=Latimeria chalumnae TaxID=7897 RepID=H3BIF7_LATCH